MRIAIVVSRFNDFVTERLLAGAREALREQGLDGADVEVLRCPARLRFPMAAQRVAETGRVAAVVCLGCLIKRRDAAFRLHRVGVCARHHRGGGGDRRADGVRRADDEFGRRGARARRCPATATKAAKPRWRRWRWRACSRRSATAVMTTPAPATAAMGGPAPGARGARCRCCTRPRSAALALAEAAGTSCTSATTTRWPSTTSARDYAVALARGRLERRARHSTSYIADAARNWRVERLAVVDRLVLRLAVHELLRASRRRRRASSSTKPSSWRAPIAATRRPGSSTACWTASSSG